MLGLDGVRAWATGGVAGICTYAVTHTVFTLWRANLYTQQLRPQQKEGPQLFCVRQFMRLYLHTVALLRSMLAQLRRTLMLLCYDYRILQPKQTELKEPEQTVMLQVFS